jgi:hypothetical protein
MLCRRKTAFELGTAAEGDQKDICIEAKGHEIV